MPSSPQFFRGAAAMPYCDCRRLARPDSLFVHARAVAGRPRLHYRTSARATHVARARCVVCLARSPSATSIMRLHATKLEFEAAPGACNKSYVKR
eukprot:scaffold124266_cov33-Tisochrysis_lutea.AAC.1